LGPDHPIPPGRESEFDDRAPFKPDDGIFATPRWLIVVCWGFVGLLILAAAAGSAK
jgi:hypothetical protein